MVLKVKTKLWIYPGVGGWHFATINKKVSKAIKQIAPPRGWGSVPVKATIGKTSWKTSIFPNSKTQEYFLPVKANVRKAEMIKAGDLINITITI